MKRYWFLLALLVVGCEQAPGEKPSLTGISPSKVLLSPPTAMDLSGNWREETRIIEDTCGFGAWRGYRGTIFDIAQVGDSLALDDLSIYREPFMNGSGSLDRRQVQLHLTRHQLQQPPDCFVDFDQETRATVGSDEMHGQQSVTYTATGNCNLLEFIPTGNNPCRLSGEFHLWKCAAGNCFEGQVLRKPVPRPQRRLDPSVFDLPRAF